MLTHLMQALVFVLGSGGGVSTADGVGQWVVDMGDGCNSHGGVDGGCQLLSSVVVDGLVLVVIVVSSSGWVVGVEGKLVMWQSQTTRFGKQQSVGHRMSPLGY